MNAKSMCLGNGGLSAAKNSSDGTASTRWMLGSSGTLMAGLGYAAVSTLRGAATDRDYHYGVAPQALGTLHVIFGDRSALDLTAREYYVSRVGGVGPGGHDNIARADIAYTWRIKDRHAVTVKYLWNRRDAAYTDLGDRSQTRGTVGIFYTLLGADHFGRVEWK